MISNEDKDVVLDYIK